MFTKRGLSVVVIGVEYTMNEKSSDRPLDALIAEYVAGNLSAPAKVMVDAHMELVPDARRWVAELENVQAMAMSDARPVAMTNSDQMISRIVESDVDQTTNVFSMDMVDCDASNSSSMPTALEDYIGMKIEDVPWRVKMPGVRSYRIDEADGFDVSLLRIKPGVAIPGHTHDGRELTLVLQGAFHDGEGNYGRGDISVADEHVDHQPIASEGEDCICFIVADAPLRFKSTIARLVSSILPN